MWSAVVAFFLGLVQALLKPKPVDPTKEAEKAGGAQVQVQVDAVENAQVQAAAKAGQAADLAADRAPGGGVQPLPDDGYRRD